MKKPANRLTLYLEGPRITADRFVRAVNAFFDLITEVAEQVEGRKRPVRWIVSVEPGSVQLNSDPQALKPFVKVGKIANTIVDGMRSLDRSSKRPEGFSNLALRKAKDLGGVADGVDIERAKIRLSRKAASVRKDTVAHVDRILGVTSTAFGSVEGTLETFSIHGGPHLAVYDSLTGRKIECIVPPEKLEEYWKNFGKRVYVFGLIRYNREGEPLSIEVENLEELPTHGLPTAEDVYGILSEV
ncbi:MAG: hypothetical protein WAM82_11855 [Thermoanaerobaculia bacterium]